MSQAVLKSEGDDSQEMESLTNAFSEYISYTECKRLFHQLDISRDKTGFKSLAVLSSYPQEGKSFLVLTLAVGYASLMGMRVLIADVVNQPHNRMLFRESLTGKGQNATPSVSTVSAGKRVPLRGVSLDATRRGKGHIELLSTRNTEGGNAVTTDFQIVPYINTLKDEFDLILFDTCAFESANSENIDPVIIARGADASILVTSPRSIGNNHIVRIRENLEKWDIKLLGTVFNDGRER